MLKRVRKNKGFNKCHISQPFKMADPANRSRLHSAVLIELRVQCNSTSFLISIHDSQLTHYFCNNFQDKNSISWISQHWEVLQVILGLTAHVTRNGQVPLSNIFIIPQEKNVPTPREVEWFMTQSAHSTFALNSHKPIARRIQTIAKGWSHNYVFNDQLTGTKKKPREEIFPFLLLSTAISQAASN